MTTTIDHHVGLEIECIVPMQYERRLFWGQPEYVPKTGKLVPTLKSSGLYEDVELDFDGSIDCDPDKEEDLELKIRFKESNTEAAIRTAVQKLREYKAKVNESCGLHVHLDARNRDKEELYARLLRALPFMQRLVKPERLSNDYCKLNSGHNIDFYDRYMAINPRSYERHKTIEVRLHHATLNANDMLTWVDFLIRVANMPPPARSPKTPKGAERAWQWPEKFTEEIRKKVRRCRR